MERIFGLKDKKINKCYELSVKKRQCRSHVKDVVVLCSGDLFTEMTMPSSQPQPILSVVPLCTVKRR